MNYDRTIRRSLAALACMLLACCAAPNNGVQPIIGENVQPSGAAPFELDKAVETADEPKIVVPKGVYLPLFKDGLFIFYGCAFECAYDKASGQMLPGGLAFFTRTSKWWVWESAEAKISPSQGREPRTIQEIRTFWIDDKLPSGERPAMPDSSQVPLHTAPRNLGVAGSAVTGGLTAALVVLFWKPHIYRVGDPLSVAIPDFLDHLHPLTEAELAMDQTSIASPTTAIPHASLPTATPAVSGQSSAVSSQQPVVGLAPPGTTQVTVPPAAPVDSVKLASLSRPVHLNGKVLTGEEFRIAFDRLKQVDMHAPSGRTLRLNFDDDQVRVENLSRGGRATGHFSADEDRSFVCLSDMRPASFKQMETCYQMIRSAEGLIEFRSIDSPYFLVTISSP